MPAYEYRRATWDEVTRLGPQGWRLVPVPPIAEMRQGLAGPQMSEPLYALEREVRAGPGPGAGHALGRAAELRAAGMSHLGVAADEMGRDAGTGA